MSAGSRACAPGAVRARRLPRYHPGRMSSHEADPKRPPAPWIGAGMAVGAGIGAAIGASTGNMGLWLPIGIAIGLAIGVAATRKRGG